jgi:hypothetical protein
MDGRPSYPLVVRNRAPLFARGFALLFMSVLALITVIVLRARPPSPTNWYQLYMLAFWAGGMACLVWAFHQEIAVIRVTNPGSIHIERGLLWNRVDHWVPSARFWIEEGKDDDGDPYFKLKMDAPGGPLVVKEGHGRERLEKLQAEIEAAVSGR